MDRQIPKYESTINFEIEQVKKAILKFADLNSKSDFYLKEQNDIFGSYNFFISKRNANGTSLITDDLSQGSMHITVQPLDGRTKILIETSVLTDAIGATSDITDAQNDFLRALANILSGNTDISKSVVKKGKGNPGRMGCLIIIIIIIAILYFYLR